MIYDIIGDIHGYADKLIGLLHTLGYEHNGSHFVPPPNHRAIFIGDLIDRGDQELKTLDIVYAMLDANVADAVMGNHEYNALAYATRDQHSSGYLRSHSSAHHRQHEAFLQEAPFGSPAHTHWLNRLYELPLWIETPHACFVHACWDSKHMRQLAPLLTQDHRLTPQALQASGQKNSMAYHAIERILKGVEAPLPQGLFMTDKDGTKRHHVRVKWWLDNLQSRTLADIARAPASGLDQLPKAALNCPMTASLDFQLTTHKPIFIGHYWLTGTPEPLSEQVVCTDYSAASPQGYLTAYRFDSDNPTLSAHNFIQYQHDNPQA